MGVRELSDSMLIAFLDFRGATIQPRTDGTGRVTFVISSTNLDELIGEYYANPQVPLIDYLHCLRKIKTAIFDLKGSAR
jgi:hypothetical protein